MCTYTIAVDDALMERVRPAFADNAAIGDWMQSQIEVLLLQVASGMEHQEKAPLKLSQRLRGIASAPRNFDYKKELANRYID